MQKKINSLLINYFELDTRRIVHAQQVLHHALRISEDYPNIDRNLLIAVSLLHDVGIKKSEILHGYNNAKTQERYGPDIAECLLQSINFPAHRITKVKEIIGNHHSPSRYNYIELKILKQADAIVNDQDKKRKSRL